ALQVTAPGSCRPWLGRPCRLALSPGRSCRRSVRNHRVRFRTRHSRHGRLGRSWPKWSPSCGSLQSIAPLPAVGSSGAPGSASDDLSHTDVVCLVEIVDFLGCPHSRSHLTPPLGRIRSRELPSRPALRHLPDLGRKTQGMPCCAAPPGVVFWCLRRLCVQPKKA